MQLLRLHAGHFSFVRSIIEGLDVASSWRRYLHNSEQRPSTTEINRVIRQVKDAFLVALHTHRSSPVMQLVVGYGLQGSAKKSGSDILGSLIHKHDLEDFSEVEQLQYYSQQRQDQHGSIPRTRVAARTSQQLAALTWLQSHYLATDVPNGADLISSWMDTCLAKRLAIVNLSCLSELVSYIDRNGARWWSRIPGMGIVKATRIVDWLDVYGNEICTTSQKHALCHANTWSRPTWRPEPIHGATIVPLEKLALSTAFLTRFAALRAPQKQCLITATCDVEALRIWLYFKHSAVVNQSVVNLSAMAVPGWDILHTMSNTQRSYWKEAERFFLWLVLEKNTTLSALTQALCQEYIAFLQYIPEHWCAARGHAKSGLSWRPFEKSLSVAARHRAVKLLRGLYDFFVQQRYLISNPWTTLHAVATEFPIKIARCSKTRFSPAAKNIIQQQLKLLSKTSSNQRLTVAISLFQDTGASIGVLVRACVNDICVDATDMSSLRLKIGSPSIFLLQSYLMSRGLDADFDAPANADAALLGLATDASERAPWAPCARKLVDPKAPIGIGTLRDQLKRFFLECAHSCKHQPELASQFRSATSHWLR